MTPREQRLAIATATLVGAALVWVVAIEPITTQWGELEAERSRLARAADEDEQAARRLRDLVQERRDFEAGLQAPEGEALVPWLAAHLRELTRIAGFEPSAVRYVGGRPLETERRDQPSAFAEIRFELRAQATLHELEVFGAELIASDRYVRISSFTFSPARGPGDVLDADLTIVALASADVLAQGGER